MSKNHNNQKKIAVINDLTGFGRCSLTVSIPIISAMRIQCCPIPTSILSNHTAYDRFFMVDFTKEMPDYIEEWKHLDLQFSGISTGFLGSMEQFEIVHSFLEQFKGKDTIVEVDPVMADGGSLYSGYSQEMCEQMKELIPLADIITPNLTEACLLTNTPYHDNPWKMKELKELAQKLSDMGPEKIVITGIPQGEFVSNLCLVNGVIKIVRSHKIGVSRAGTGDVFASMVIADAVNGVDFETSVRKATRFIKKCLIKSNEMQLPIEDGICFEEYLTKLR